MVAIYAQEAWREGTKYLAGLHAEGLLASEIFTQDRDQIRSLGNGRDGVAMLGSATAGWFGDFMTFTAGQSGPSGTPTPPCRRSSKVRTARATRCTTPSRRRSSARS